MTNIAEDEDEGEGEEGEEGGGGREVVTYETEFEVRKFIQRSELQSSFGLSMRIDSHVTGCVSPMHLPYSAYISRV